MCLDLSIMQKTLISGPTTISCNLRRGFDSRKVVCCGKFGINALWNNVCAQQSLRLSLHRPEGTLPGQRVASFLAEFPVER